MQLIANNTVLKTVSDITITENLDTLTNELTFSLPFAPNDNYLYNLTPQLQVGDAVTAIGDSGEMFSGIIVNKGIKNEFTAYSNGYYLTNNDVILQCNSINAAEAVKMLCAKLGINCSVPNMPATIKKTYIEESAADIVTDIIDQTTAAAGINYFARVEGQSLNIYEYPNTHIDAIHKFETGNTLNVTYALGDVSGEDSIKDLRNKVIVVSDTDDSIKILAEKSDGASISKFGQLTKVKTATGDTENPVTLAENTLKELNTITKSRSIDNMLGSEAVHAGTMLLFSSKKYDVYGLYLVQTVKHEFKSTGHTMSLTLLNTEGA